MLIVGIGGTRRPGSSSETALKIAAAAAAGRGADTLIFSAEALELPVCNPADPVRAPRAQRLIAAGGIRHRGRAPLDTRPVALEPTKLGNYGDRANGGTPRGRVRET
jgi:hypothetical protein